MSTELIINASLPETRIALMEDGEIQELLIERASGKGIVGNIYKGRVTRVLPGMQAAFVDIGLEKAAFLYVDDVYVHSEIWEEEEGTSGPLIPDQTETGQDVQDPDSAAAPAPSITPRADVQAEGQGGEVSQEGAQPAEGSEAAQPMDENAGDAEEGDIAEGSDLIEGDPQDLEDEEDDDEDEGEPVRMGPPPGDDGNGDSEGNRRPEGTIAPEQGNRNDARNDTDDSIGNRVDAAPRHEEHSQSSNDDQFAGNRADNEGSQDDAGQEPAEGNVEASQDGNQGDRQSSERYQNNRNRRTHRRGRRGGRNRRRDGQGGHDHAVSGDRQPSGHGEHRQEFNEHRSRDRRIKPKPVRNIRGQVNIQDLLQEGQELVVQVAKDPIATKGARLTCHISLPGRHLVCMPTIDHVGVSRRIERDDERRRLRDFVERYRPRNLGFIVRTASGKANCERRIKQDIEYLTRLWDEIRQKASEVSAPALVYEDLNSVLRAIRDWVTEDIDKIIVDSRYHYNEIMKFVSHFMPPLRQKAELYHGDIPIFDAYNISTELSRSLERKVWLKSGGYIVIDQAEALVAIDVNTGRYVGKKNLEDTILKTNLEAVQEIAYQLRLRNCGGIIILDLIDMEKEDNKQRVYRALEEALKKDRARPTILKISELGLVEMTRKRTRDTIMRTLCETCSHCEGKGFIKSKQTVGYEILRELEREGIERDVTKILVQAHADVIDILAIDERETLDQLERRYRKTIYLQAVSDFHPEQFEVVSEKRESAERGEGARAEPGYERQGRSGRDHRRGSSQQQSSGPAPVIKIKPVAAKPEAQEGAEPQAGEAGPEQDQAIGAEGEQQDAPESLAQEDADFGPETGDEEGDSEAPQADEGAGPSDSDEEAPRGPADFDNEEDRLAYLRAQAAQDAALANQTAGGNQGRQSRPGFQNKDRQGGGGGKRWNGRNNNRGRNNKRRGGRGGGRFQGQGQGQGPGRRDFGRNDQNQQRPTDDRGGNDGGGSGGGSNDPGTSHSQPPVT